MIVLGDDGKALFVNAAMRAIADRRDGPTLDRNGRPRPAQVGGAGPAERADKRCNRGQTRRHGDRSARSSGAGLSRAGVATGRVAAVTALGQRPPPAAIVLVHDPDSRPRQAEDILQVGLGLTPGAARLVAALAADDDLKACLPRARA